MDVKNGVLNIRSVRPSADRYGGLLKRETRLQVSGKRRTICGGMGCTARTMPDLSVTVDRHGIAVSEPGTEFSVIYRREGSVLVADDLMRKKTPAPSNWFSSYKPGKPPSPRRSRLGGFALLGDSGAFSICGAKILIRVVDRRLGTRHRPQSILGGAPVDSFTIQQLEIQPE